MSRKINEISSGLGLLIGLWGFIYALLRLKLIIPPNILQWLSQSPAPQRAVIFFSGVVACVLLVLLRIGVEVPAAKPILSSERFRSYAAGLPLWTVIVIFTFSIIGLFAVYPSCQSPTSIHFNIEGNDSPLQPDDMYEAKPNSRLTVSAEPIVEGALLSCQWQASGDAFQTLSTITRCQISVTINKQGTGYLTVQTSQDFCEQNSIFSLIVKVKP